VYEAVVEWHNAGASQAPEVVADIESRIFATWDPVQRAILVELFTAYRRLHHPGVTDVDVNPEGGRWDHRETNTKVTVGVQLDVHDGGNWEAVRIKTGRSGTTELEAAAFYRPGEQRILVDVQLSADDRVTIPRPDPDASGRLLVDVARRWDATIDRPHNRVAGLHCYSCDRPARCGQYPVIEGGVGDIGRWTRTIRISKTRLAALERCQRSSLWPALYAIPKDDPDEGESTSAGLALGNSFHEAVAAALLAEDPDAVFGAACDTVPKSEADDLQSLFDRHGRLWESEAHPVTAHNTEYQFGVTLVVDGLAADSRGITRSKPVAVTMMCATDVNGWESENVAAVVEHRTGVASKALDNEADLYAASAWAALDQTGRDVDGVAVHFHHLRNDPPECERHFFDSEEVGRAIRRLQTVAARIAALHPQDATEPLANPGQWCEWCEWVHRCLEHRD